MIIFFLREVIWHIVVTMIHWYSAIGYSGKIRSGMDKVSSCAIFVQFQNKSAERYWFGISNEADTPAWNFSVCDAFTGTANDWRTLIGEKKDQRTFPQNFFLTVNGWARKLWKCGFAYRVSCFLVEMRNSVKDNFFSLSHSLFSRLGLTHRGTNLISCANFLVVLIGEKNTKKLNSSLFTISSCPWLSTFGEWIL